MRVGLQIEELHEGDLCLGTGIGDEFPSFLDQGALDVSVIENQCVANPLVGVPCVQVVGGATPARR